MLQLIDQNTVFYMGGYGVFVWPAYAAMLIILVFNLVLPIRRHRKIKAKLRSGG